MKGPKPPKTCCCWGRWVGAEFPNPRNLVLGAGGAPPEGAGAALVGAGEAAGAGAAGAGAAPPRPLVKATCGLGMAITTVEMARRVGGTKRKASILFFGKLLLVVWKKRGFLFLLRDGRFYRALLCAH